MRRKWKMGFRFVYMVLVLIAGIFGTIVKGLPTKMQHNDQCSHDLHCSTGFFCYERTQTCIACREVDCSKYNRLPGTTKCPKSKNECGPCKNGYIFKSGYCTASFVSLDLNEHLDFINGTGDLEIFEAPRFGLNSYFYRITTVIVASSSILALTVYFSRKKWSGRNFECHSTRDETASAPLTIDSPDFEPYTRPPPYNMGLENSTCSLPFENEGHAQAIPFDHGNFASVDQSFIGLNDENGELPQTFLNPFASESGNPENDSTVPDIENQNNSIPEYVNSQEEYEAVVPFVPQVEQNNAQLPAPPPPLPNNNDNLFFLINFQAFVGVGALAQPAPPEAENENQDEDEVEIVEEEEENGPDLSPPAP